MGRNQNKLPILDSALPITHNPEISIIIIVKNDLGIRDTLELIAKQVTSSTFETIVVDASDPKRLASVKAEFPNVRWAHYDQKGKRYTFAEQRNAGIQMAKGDIIVFIDANCLPTSKWLEYLITDIGSGENIVCGPCDPSNANNLVHYTAEHETKRYVPECTTMNVALTRQVIKEVGKFDENLGYGEDVDFFWRVIDAGFKLCFEPKAAITHDYGDTNEQIGRAFKYGKSRAILHRKHWRKRLKQLFLREPHVWIYPTLILSVVPGLFWHFLLLFPVIAITLLILKNRSIGTVFHHFVFATGVLSGLFAPNKHV